MTVDTDLLALRKRAHLARRLDPIVAHAIAVGAGFLRQGAALVAIDPGASTGWCVRWTVGRPILHSGQDEPALAAGCVLAVLGDRPIGLLVIEEPLGRGRGRNALVKLPWAAGEVRGRLASQQVDESCLWTPLPSPWRSVLGLSKGKREEVNEAVHTWTEAKLSIPLRTHTGAPEFDRASAVALSYAAEAVCSTLAASQQPRSST